MFFAILARNGHDMILIRAEIFVYCTPSITMDLITNIKKIQLFSALRNLCIYGVILTTTKQILCDLGIANYRYNYY